MKDVISAKLRVSKVYLSALNAITNLRGRVKQTADRVDFDAEVFQDCDVDGIEHDMYYVIAHLNKLSNRLDKINDAEKVIRYNKQKVLRDETTKKTIN